MIPTVDSVLMLSSPFIPPDSGNNPSIVLKWADNNGIEDRICGSASCPFTINSVITNPLGVSVTTKIQYSTDAVTWNDVTTLQTYTDIITDTTKFYRAVVLTSTQSFYSNVLKYEKQNAPASITAINILNDSGQTSYDLVVEGAPFVGYMIMSGTREYNMKDVQVYHSFDGNLNTFNVPNSTPYGTPAYGPATVVNIPVGVYPDCQLRLFGSPVLIGSHSAAASGELSFSTTPNFDDGVLFLEAYRLVEGD